MDTVMRNPLACVGTGLGSAVLAAIVSVFWTQYSLLLSRSLPKRVDLGLPFFGHTLAIFREGIENWAKTIINKYEPFDAVLLCYLFQPTVLISNKLYKERVLRLDNDGELITVFPPGMDKLIGPHSLIVLPGGKGHTQHHRIRAKCLRALAPKQVLGQLPMIKEVVGKTLEDMVLQTSQKGSTPFCKAVEEMAFKVSATMILGADFAEEVKQLRECFGLIVEGLFAPPLNLGRFSAHGRALLARNRLLALLKELMTKPAIQRTALGELLIASEEGTGLCDEEILDSVLTMLLAGQLTTKDAIPRLLLDLAEHPAIVEQIRAEAEAGLEFKSVEEDSTTLRFITESLRCHPPAGAFRRACPSREIDLGAAGCVPKGCSLALLVTDSRHEGINIENPVYQNHHESYAALQDVFGGKQPHSCVGKSLAVLELQVFLRELCSKYKFDVLDAVFQPVMGMAGWRNDLPVRILKRSS